MKRILGVFLIASVGGATSLGLNHLFVNADELQATPSAFNQPVRLANLPNVSPENTIDFRNAAELSVHSVVHVKTEMDASAYNQFHYDPFRDFFNYDPWGQQQRKAQASGSGVIISADGYIVTNNHVIDRADKIEVTLNDKRTYKAEVIGKDPTTDLALIKISEKNLPFMAYGNSDDVRVGEWVLAVGNPFNLTSTVTAGIVSAKARNINILESDPSKGVNPVESFIQTDAAVNPGNSGGALVNTKGELIGINTAIASNTGSYAGYAFAIPANMVRKITADLLEYGTVQRAYLGVSIREVDSKLADEKDLAAGSGVYVNGVVEGGSADDAGIKEGDLITKVGAASVNSVPELQEQVSRFRPGDKIKVTVKRGKQETELALVLKNKNNNTSVVEKEKTEAISALGATFETVTSEEKSKLQIENGLKVTKLDGGKLRGAGIKEGFIITSIDKKKITSTEDLKNTLENKKGGILIEGVYPNGMRAYYAFGL